MAFHDVRLPDDIEQGALGGPGFLTTIVATASGFEQRNQEWEAARLSWDIAYGIRDKTGYQSTVKFFLARRGRLHGFRFKDWSDFEASESILGTGDDTTTDFQLIKTYEDDGGSYTRVITRPVAETLVVRMDGVVQTLATDYVLNDGGVVAFVVPPAMDTVIDVDFEFDVPVRFDVDKMAVALTWINAGSINDLSVIELPESAASIAAEADSLQSLYDTGYDAGFAAGELTNMIPWALDTGAVDELLAVYSPIPTLEDGFVARVRAGANNTDPNPTFEITGTNGPHVITKTGAATLSVDDIVEDSDLWLSYHDVVTPYWELMNPATL